MKELSALEVAFSADEEVVSVAVRLVLICLSLLVCLLLQCLENEQGTLEEIGVA